MNKIKFIDLYNKNKKHPVYQDRVHKYKLYCYLAKTNPDEFDIRWQHGNFKCFQKIKEFVNTEAGRQDWVKWKVLYNSGEENTYKTMGDFKPAQSW